MPHSPSSWLLVLSRRLSVILGLGVLILCGATLAGWYLELPTLQSPFKYQVSMKANTTVGLILAAVLVLVARCPRYFLVSVVRWLLVIPLFLIASLTLLQYIFGVDIKIDELLVRAPRYEPLTSSPGRMAPTTAVGFLLLAIALGIDHWQTGVARGFSRILATLLLLLALTTILGYAYDAPAMYLAIDGFTAMSLLTAMFFMALAFGVIWLHPEFGFPAMFTENSMVGTHIRALLPLVVGAPLLVGAAVAAGRGRMFEGHLAIALTSLGSVVAAGLVAVVTIVVLRRAEDALYIRDRALAVATNGVVITDHRQINEPIVFVNSAFSVITGYGAEEAVGRNCRFLNTGVENSTQVFDELRQCIKDGRSGEFELKNRRKDGSDFWNRLSIAPIRDYESAITHFVGIIDDMTDRREQQQQLQNALAEAREANRMRNTFVRLVGHELRTPLNAALTWTRLLEVDDSPETVRKGLKVVSNSIESQSRLIDDLVDVTRFAAAGVRLEPEHIDVKELLTLTLDELRPSIEASTQELSIDVSEDEITARFDSLRFQQIVRNLVTNANKYTPAGGRISVHLRKEDGDIVLTVSDTGVGLSSDEIKQVFEAFWRAKSHQPGLGVGLSIVLSLVSAHQGTITVTSDGPGQGSTFTVRLPSDFDNPNRATLQDDTGENAALKL